MSTASRQYPDWGISIQPDGESVSSIGLDWCCHCPLAESLCPMCYSTVYVVELEQITAGLTIADSTSPVWCCQSSTVTTGPLYVTHEPSSTVVSLDRFQR